MLSFCKRVFFHYLFSHTDENEQDRRRRHRRMKIQPISDYGLAVIFLETKKLDHVLESYSLKKLCKKQVLNNSGGGYCFLDLIMNSGSGGGGGSCTESLGFESSDQMEEEEEDEDDHEIIDELRSKSVVGSKWRTMVGRSSNDDDEVIKVRSSRRRNSFPPPLSSLNQNGQPSFFLKPVRKNGRLELTEFRINRPVEFLRASRQDGRLRLHLVVSQPTLPEICQQEETEQVEEEQETEQVEEEEEEEEEEETEHEQEQEQEPEPEEQEIDLNEEEEEEEVRESVRETKFRLASGGGGRDGFRRCQEIRNRHHHHHLPIWKQHQVTTRSTVRVL